VEVPQVQVVVAPVAQVVVLVAEEGKSSDRTK